MLEMPESYTIAGEIKKNLTGKIVSYFEVLHTPHRFAFFKGEQKHYQDLLEGQKIVDAVSHGGLVEIDLEDSMIVFGDGAYPKYFDDKKKFPKNHQFALYFDDETAIFVSIQMYGEIFIYPKGTCEDEYYLAAIQKPGPLTKEFTLDYFKNLFFLANKKLTAKTFLATEQRIPGLGNGVLQDILWDAGIDPRHIVQEEDLPILYESVKRVLNEMIKKGGRDTEKTLFGEKGGYITQLSKNSLFQPCMKCGTEIQKAAYMGGTVYFCEKCQKR